MQQKENSELRYLVLYEKPTTNGNYCFDAEFITDAGLNMIRKYGFGHMKKWAATNQRSVHIVEYLGSAIKIVPEVTITDKTINHV